MSDPVILFVKPKELRPADKAALRKAGVVVVECPNPESMKLVRATTEFSSSGLLEVLMRSVNASTNAQNHLGAECRAAISKAILAPRSKDAA